MVILASLILLTGCNMEKYHIKKCNKWGVCGTDSVITIIKDSVITNTEVIPESSMWMDLSFKCDSDRMVLLQKIDSLNSVNADMQIKFKDGKLTVYVKVPKREIKIMAVVKNRTVVEYKYAKVSVPLKWYDNMCLWTGRFVWLILIIGLIYHIIKFVRKII